MIRNTEDVIADLKALINTRGYIYSLCLILFEDFHLDLNMIHEIDQRLRLSVKECSLIMGFLVQKEIDFSLPTSPDEVFVLKEKTYDLMSELQMSFNAPQFAKIQKIIERKEKGEQFIDNRESRLNFFVKDKAMVEPMFYAGDGVYDFQYLEYLEAKYKYDNEWLQKNRGFDIGNVRKIAEMIQLTLHAKAQKVNPVNLRQDFPKVAQRVRKKLKKKFSTEKIDEMEQQNLMAATFYQYVELFPAPGDRKHDPREGWNQFYKNLLDLFTITPSDLAIVEQRAVKNFLQNFSFSPGCNDTYEGPGHFNILNSCPLIKLEGERYFVAINYLIPEAIYETPFYWMWEDKKYRDSLAKHRGSVGEEIAFDLLSKVFGIENTFKSVLVETKKGHRDTDIDILCLLGNKAICVQVKSKKLTLTAKRGDYDQLSKDFNGAVQDAYNQGLVSRQAILNKQSKFFDDNGSELFLPAEINEVYIMGVTTENYPALVQQVNMMLVKKSNDPYPLFLSVFDLELLVHYLKDPYDFLYYVRQRIDLIEYFKADEELTYLGYHLDKKLWKLEQSDGCVLNTDFGAIVHRNYYPYKIGVSHLLSDDHDPIQNRWKDPKFDLFVETVKNVKHPKATDIVFHLLDWSGNTRKNIVEQMSKLKDISQIEGSTKSLAIATDFHFGLSYVVVDIATPSELDERYITYAKLRKYVTKCNAWLGLGAFSTSPDLINGLIYMDEPWQIDVKLENEYGDTLSKMRKAPITLLGAKKKIGRNEPCPCESGKKYKKCCIGRSTF